MAFAIMGGLFVATMLTLIVLPALYVAWFRVKEPARESRGGLSGDRAVPAQRNPAPVRRPAPHEGAAGLIRQRPSH